jgi:hypothetical protein
MVYHVARGVTVLVGGLIQPSDNETWEWDGIAWTLSPAAGPTRRGHGFMVYDGSRQRAVLFGGQSGSYLNETWEYMNPIPGDIDLDGDVDLNDFATFAGCFLLTEPVPGLCEPDEFAASDMSGDGHVDLNDFNTFAVNFTG